MNLIKKHILAVAAISLTAGAVSAQDTPMITLKSLDGKVVMTGELQGFEAGHYNIIVAGLGLVSVAQDVVTCQSDAGDCVALISES